jgi:hypothetical protein
MVDLNHLSYSSISSYQLCARAWRYHYLDKVEVPTASALIFGSAFHGAVEDYVRSKALGQRKALGDCWQTSWEHVSQDEVDWAGELPEQLANTGMKLLTCPDTVVTLEGLNPLMEDDQPVIEKRIELHVPGVPLPIIGYIDVIDEYGVPGDFKTAGRAWTGDQAEKETQPLFYLAALNQLGYRLNPENRFRHYVFVKTRTPQVQVIDSQHSVSQMLWLFQSIKEVWRGIEAGVFPMNPGSWKCDQKWCPYWSMCRGKA